jgi:hypothetical protein
VLGARDGLDAAVTRARRLDTELSEARRHLLRHAELPAIRGAYAAALAEAVIWTRRIMDAAPACPFCSAPTPAHSGGAP